MTSERCVSRSWLSLRHLLLFGCLGSETLPRWRCTLVCGNGRVSLLYILARRLIRRVEHHLAIRESVNEVGVCARSS